MKKVVPIFFSTNKIFLSPQNIHTNIKTQENSDRKIKVPNKNIPVTRHHKKEKSLFYNNVIKANIPFHSLIEQIDTTTTERKTDRQTDRQTENIPLSCLKKIAY